MVMSTATTLCPLGGNCEDDLFMRKHARTLGHARASYCTSNLLGYDGQAASQSLIRKARELTWRCSGSRSALHVWTSSVY